MDIWKIVVGIAACVGLAWLYPRSPRAGQIAILIFVGVVCAVVIANLVGLPLHF